VAVFYRALNLSAASASAAPFADYEGSAHHKSLATSSTSTRTLNSHTSREMASYYAASNICQALYEGFDFAALVTASTTLVKLNSDAAAAANAATDRNAAGMTTALATTKPSPSPPKRARQRMGARLSVFLPRRERARPPPPTAAPPGPRVAISSSSMSSESSVAASMSPGPPPPPPRGRLARSLSGGHASTSTNTCSVELEAAQERIEVQAEVGRRWLTTS
jgi:hypothetical protein